MFSILIPVYNGAEWLAEAIESALAQTIKCEVIVIDDGSTDNSLEIAKSYPVKVVFQVNKGLVSARNTGIMNATNEFCLFLDADDILLPQAAEKVLEKIKKSNADIVALSFREFGLSNAEVMLLPDPELKDFKIGNRLGYCQAIRRSCLLDVGGYSPKMVEGYEDLHLTINLISRAYKLVTIQEVLWLYRTKKNSMITKAVQYHKKLLAQINKDFPQVNLDF